MDNSSIVGDRRGCPRQIVNSPVYANLGPSAGGFLCDLSEGGLAIDVFGGLCNQAIGLKFDLPDTNYHIEAIAQISWTNELGRRAGLKFVDISERSRRRIGDWISLQNIVEGSAAAAQRHSDSPIRWKEGPIRLEFLLGYFRLFAATFRGMLCTDSNHLCIGSPIPDLPLGIDVALILRALIPDQSQALPTLRSLPKVFRYVPHQLPNLCIDLSGTFEDYLKKFSSKSRSTLKRKLRKFTEAAGGSIQWREFRTSFEIVRFCNLARQVRVGTFQSTFLGASVSADPLEIVLLAHEGSVRAYLLFLRKKPIAYLCCFRENNYVVHWFSGYDPEYRGFSPGLLLQYLALKRLFLERRFRIFDFMTGGGQHKQFFSTGSLKLADVYYFRKNLRNIVIVAVHVAFSFSVRKAVGLLRALGIETAARKFARRFATTRLGLAFRRREAS